MIASYMCCVRSSVMVDVMSPGSVTVSLWKVCGISSRIWSFPAMVMGPVIRLMAWLVSFTVSAWMMSCMSRVVCSLRLVTQSVLFRCGVWWSSNNWVHFPLRARVMRRIMVAVRLSLPFCPRWPARFCLKTSPSSTVMAFHVFSSLFLFSSAFASSMMAATSLISSAMCR